MIVRNDDNEPEFDPSDSGGDWKTYRRLVLGELQYIKKQIELLEGKFVSKTEFYPIKIFVYSLVGLVLSTVFIALLALVIRGKI